MSYRRKADVHSISEMLKFRMLGFTGKTRNVKESLFDPATPRGQIYWMHKRADLRELSLELEKITRLADEIIDIYEQGAKAATSEVCCGGELVEQWKRCSVCGEVNRPSLAENEFA